MSVQCVCIIGVCGLLGVGVCGGARMDAWNMHVSGMFVHVFGMCAHAGLSGQEKAGNEQGRFVRKKGAG